MQIDFEKLEPHDKLTVQVLDENAEIGVFEMALQDQFGRQLQGDFDKWFKLYIHESPTRVKTSSNPSKSSANSSFTRLYEDDPSMDIPQRIGRIRITMSLGSVIVAPNEGPKVTEIVQIDEPMTLSQGHRPTAVSAVKSGSPTPQKEGRTPLPQNVSYSPTETKDLSPSNRSSEDTANRSTMAPSLLGSILPQGTEKAYGEVPKERTAPFPTAGSPPRVKPRVMSGPPVASSITEKPYESPHKSRYQPRATTYAPDEITETVITKELPRSPQKWDANQQKNSQLAQIVRESQDRLVELQRAAPTALDDCPRCGYLEKLSVTQQNDLLGNDAMRTAYCELKCLMKEQDEEELKLPPHLKMEYDHRGDQFRQSIDPNIDDCVAVDIPTNLKYGTGGLNPSEAEHLRMIILGLNEKLKGMQMLQAENKSLRQQIENDKKSRQDLQQSMRETTQQLHAAHEKQVADNEKIGKERLNAVDSLHQQHINFKEKCKEVEGLETKIKELTAQMARNEAEKSNFTDQTAQIDSVCKALNDSEDKRRELQNQNQISIADFNQRMQEQMTINRDLLEEIKRLQQIVEDQQKENNDQKNKIYTMQIDMNEKDGKISCLESEVSIITDKEQQLEEIMGLAKDHEVGRQTLQTNLNEAAEKFRDELDAVEGMNKQLQEDKRVLNDTLNEVENNLELKNEQIKDLNAEKFALNGNVAVLEQILFEREDESHLIDDVLNQNEMYRNIKEQLMKELDFLTDYLLRQADKTLTGTRMVNKLKQGLDDKKIEIETLRNLATGFAKSRAYVPVKGDQVDEALASIINSRDTPLDIGFAREGPELYIFGTKQVGVILENDRIYIRVGKGLMSFEEFVITYTPIEQDRWENKKAKNGIRHRNIVGRMSTDLSAALKGQDVTPDKAARLLANAFSA